MKIIESGMKKSKKEGESTYGGTNLGTFMTYAKSIHLQKVLNLILGFTFNVWALYLDFHTVNVIFYIYLKNQD
jgi:hypothetical protein